MLWEAVAGPAGGCGWACGSPLLSWNFVLGLWEAVVGAVGGRGWACGRAVTGFGNARAGWAGWLCWAGWAGWAGLGLVLIL